MFRLPIPSQIDLSYTDSQGQTILLNTEEDYQGLMRNNSNKPVKITITEKRQPIIEEEGAPLNGEYGGEGAEYEVIPHYREEKIEENQREKEYGEIIEVSEDSEQKQALIKNEQDGINDVMDEITQKIADNYIMPQVQSAPEMGAIEIKKLVKEALREEMPFIVAQVKEELLKENQARQQFSASIPEQVQPRNNLPQPCQAYYSYPYYNHPVNRFNSYPGQMQQPPVHRPVPQNFERRDRVVPEPQPQFSQGFRPAPAQVNANEGKGPQIFDKVVTALSRPVNKAGEVIDNWMMKLEGDPYVYCPEGKYNKSVVEKVAHMKEIFPEEDRKEMLEFVQKFPRDAPFDHIVSVYWSKKGVNQHEA